MNAQHTPGPWTAHRMVHADTNEPMTPEQIGEYVSNSVKKSAIESGSSDFLFVTVEKPDGPADVCHVGNGPTSPANARLIAAAPDFYSALTIADVEQIIEAIENFVMGPVEDPELDAIWLPYIGKLNALRAAIVKAEAINTIHGGEQ